MNNNDSIADRRRRAALLRSKNAEQKADAIFMKEMTGCSEYQCKKHLNDTCLINVEKSKSTRMQNSKGTASMFIKP